MTPHKFQRQQKVRVKSGNRVGRDGIVEKITRSITQVRYAVRLYHRDDYGTYLRDATHWLLEDQLEAVQDN